LALYEMTPFHDAAGIFTEMLSRAEPCVLFEDKVLYTRQMSSAAAIPISTGRWRRAGLLAGQPDCVIIAPAASRIGSWMPCDRFSSKKRSIAFCWYRLVLHPFTVRHGCRLRLRRRRDTARHVGSEWRTRSTRHISVGSPGRCS